MTTNAPFPLPQVRASRWLLLPALWSAWLTWIGFAGAPDEPVIGRLTPEIEGKDTDGRAFKLSDSRGKVVLLSFWGDW